MFLAQKAIRGSLVKKAEELMTASTGELKSALAEYLDTQNSSKLNGKATDKLIPLLQKSTNSLAKELFAKKDYLAKKSQWIFGGDGWGYDIGFGGVDHVLASNEDINIMIFDTEVYSNTGGQASKSTRTGAVAKFAAGGKETAKKNLAKIAMSYPHVYVGTISLGANAMQASKVMKEAEAYNGPSIIIAYAPCIAQGIIKGMKNSINEEKLATESGYFPLLHYNPENKEFKLDSKADFTKFEEFTLGEDRYRSLKKINKDGDKLLDQNRIQAEETYKYYQSLVNDNE
jgi:pyruvate-ferredoxin/flavodoxin oxidoreductase